MAWNCQGIKPALTNSELKRLVSCLQPSFLFLYETKNSSSKVRSKLRAVGFTSFELVDRIDMKGGLAFAGRQS
ncbi:hypothetical protein LINGRAHAP2_LOCUS2233 [Linum grandiflorum]